MIPQNTTRGTPAGTSKSARPSGGDLKASALRASDLRTSDLRASDLIIAVEATIFSILSFAFPNTGHTIVFGEPVSRGWLSGSIMALIAIGALLLGSSYLKGIWRFEL